MGIRITDELIIFRGVGEKPPTRMVCNENPVSIDDIDDIDDVSPGDELLGGFVSLATLGSVFNQKVRGFSCSSCWLFCSS